jgi:hypothetical protein
VADLRVDYQLLTSIHRTLNGLAGEYDELDGGAGVDGSVYGAGDITAAMASFSGNWAGHRKALLATIQDLGRMTAETAARFHETDSQLASALVRK